jgi:hypothetical protein
MLMNDGKPSRGVARGMENSPAGKSQADVPIGVVACGVSQIVFGGFYLLVCCSWILAVLRQPNRGPDVGWGLDPVFHAIAIGFLAAASAAAIFVSWLGRGILRLRESARVATIGVAALELVGLLAICAAALGYFGPPMKIGARLALAERPFELFLILRMAFHIVFITYSARPDVQRLFRVR